MIVVGPEPDALMSEPRILLDNLTFAECPRYRDGSWYFSDQHAGRVLRLDAAGELHEIAAVAEGCSGLGWMPDGTLLIVSMRDRRVLALRDDELQHHADLSSIATGHCNDMVVDGQGRAYVGNFGFDMDAGAEAQPGALALVLPDGTVKCAADDLMFANGMVITPDGGTLVIAESWARRLTAFRIAADGSLSERRIWAELPFAPDGICLDEDSAIWVANPLKEGGFHRVLEGGEVTETISTEPFRGIACMLGGPARRTLFMLEAKTFTRHKTVPGNARIRSVEVQIPGAGFPL